MAKEEKSISKEAILDAERIQEAINANAKEILRAVSQEEIDAIVRESLEESEYVEEDVVTEEEGMEDDTEDMDDEAGDDAGEEDMDDVDAEDDFEGGDDVEDETGDVEGSDDYEDTESDVDMEPMGDMGDSEEVMDMTGASDDDVISVYKKLSGEDEIEVVGDEITLNVSEPGEYVIKTGEGLPSDDVAAEPAMDADMGAEPEMGMDDMGADMGGEEDYEEEESDIVYEIALDEAETKIGATANGKPRTATSDVHMGSEKAAPNTGDIEGQTAPTDNDNSGDNLEGGFDEDVPNADADGNKGEMVMTEGLYEMDPEDEEPSIDDIEDVEGIGGVDTVHHYDFDNDEDEDDWGGEHTMDYLDEDGVTFGNIDFMAESEEITEEDEINEDELEETKYVGGKVEKVATAHTNKKLEESTGKYNQLLAESAKLKKENEEFRKSLKTFRGMLAETVVFNSNLTYVTKLFMEHSTTKEEKKAILARFDNDVSTIKESKKLYKVVSNELKSRKPINESVNDKLNKNAGSSTSKNLNESTAYVDPSTQRMLDLISRVEKR